jgi:hypothetical protein
LTLLIAVLAATFGTAQAAAWKQRPEGAPPAAQAVVLDRPAKTAEYLSTPLKGTDFGVVGARGSLGVGLLFGALGAAANAAHVQSVNEERGAKMAALTGTDLRGMLREELARRTPPGAPASGAGRANMELLPIAIAVFTDDARFTLRCQVWAFYPNGEGKPWRARYSVAIPDSFDVNALDVEKARQDLRDCYAAAYGLYAGHVDNTIAFGAARAYHVQDISYKQKTPFADALLPGRAVVNDALGVFEYPANIVSFDQ